LSQPKTKLEWALETAKLGLPVFPVTYTTPEGRCSCGTPDCPKPGKHPLPGSKGFKDASLDPEVIRKMWGPDPNCNPAAYPGAEFVIIDLDCKRLPNGQEIKGLTNLAEHLELDEYELLDQTRTVQTPSGGFHLYFRADNEYASGVGLIPGVDSRAVGGYVLAPGSVIHGRPYAVSHDTAMVVVPEQFSKFLRKIRDKSAEAHKPLFELDHPAAIERMRMILKERLPAIEGKGGNSHTYVTVCLVKDHAISAERCIALLMEPDGWNTRCIPPWTRAELLEVVTNAYEYGKDRPGSKGGAVLDAFEDEFQAEDAPKHLITADILPFSDGIGDANDPFAKFRANFHNAEAFKGLDLDYDMIAPGWIPASGFTCFLAKRGAGKTTILMDLCCRLANDMEWQGVELDKGWTICWIVGEDEAGAKVRMQGWEKEWGLTVDPSRFHFLTMPIDINLASQVELFARFLRQEMGDRKVVHVLDTWQRMTTSADSQSNDSAMQLAVHHVEALAKSFHGPAFVAFHPPKANANTIMGSSVIENSSQAIIQITDEGSFIHKAEVTRIKGEGHGNYAKFRFKPVQIAGLDRFGKPKTSVVAVLEEGTEIAKSPTLQAMEMAMITVLKGIVDHIGDISPGSSHNVNLSAAAKIVLSIPRRAQDRDPYFIEWEKLLEEAGWVFESETASAKLSNFQTVKYIFRLMKGTSKSYTLDMGDWGLYAEDVGKSRFIKYRALGDEMQTHPEEEQVNVDDPDEVEENVDA
jgi:hypothetical protein